MQCHTEPQPHSLFGASGAPLGHARVSSSFAPACHLHLMPRAADRLQPGLYGPLPLAAFDRIACQDSLLYLSGASPRDACHHAYADFARAVWPSRLRQQPSGAPCEPGPRGGGVSLLVTSNLFQFSAGQTPQCLTKVPDYVASYPAFACCVSCQGCWLACRRRSGWPPLKWGCAELCVVEWVCVLPGCALAVCHFVHAACECVWRFDCRAD